MISIPTSPTSEICGQIYNMPQLPIVGHGTKTSACEKSPGLKGANHVNHASEERMASTWATVYPRKSPTKCSQPEDMPWDNVLALTAPQIEMKVHWHFIFTSHEEQGRAEDAWQCNAYQDHVPTSSKYLSR